MLNVANLKLQTAVGFEWTGEKFGPDTIIAGAGSCFAQNQLDRLFAMGMQGRGNPPGIIYNAVSIAEALEAAATGQVFRSDDFFSLNNLWHSRMHHGSFSRPTVEAAVAAANDAMQAFSIALHRAGMIILTPSSSVVYEEKGTGVIFANCHRIEQSHFNRRLLSLAESVTALRRAVAAIRTVNPEALLIFTVSPIRHYPGELVLNSRSKALLLTAVHEVVDNTPNCLYFPSYEIVLDELRDYRYYAEDLIHPSLLTEKIIFGRFANAFFNVDAHTMMAEKEKENLAAAHRPRY